MTHNLRITIAALLTLNHGVSAQENTTPVPELTGLKAEAADSVEDMEKLVQEIIDLSLIHN